MEEAHEEEVEDLKSKKNEYETLLFKRIWKGESELFCKKGKKQQRLNNGKYVLDSTGYEFCGSYRY